MTAAPFRLVTKLCGCDGERAEARWRPTCGELGAAGRHERPPHVPSILVLEALVQCAGLLLQETDGGPDSYWMLSGVDDADLVQIDWDDEVALACTVQRRSSRVATLTAMATAAQGVVVCRAQILMVRA